MSMTIRSVQLTSYGSPDELRIHHIARPVPQAGEVLVRIHAAGVLPIETFIRSGQFQNYMPVTFPYTPGSAFAGIVEEVGPGVTLWNVGDPIVGRTPNGAYSEYTIVPEKPPVLPENIIPRAAGKLVIPLARKPETISFEEGATLSGGATTAWTAMVVDGQLKAGERVLILGGSGGVGLFAVQFARWLGAEVIATTSTRNVEAVRALGASIVVDYTKDRLSDLVQHVDLILDTVGGASVREALPLLRPGGRMISIMGAETIPQELVPEGASASSNSTLATSEHLERIVELLAAGEVRPIVQQVFPLEEAPAAHRLVETRHGMGRVILRAI